MRTIDRYARKQEWKFRGKGPGGRNLCHCGCDREVVPPRRTCFSDECLEWYNSHSNPARIRHRVANRDKGVCALCGMDTVKEFRAATETIQLWHWLARREAERLFDAGLLLDQDGQPEKFWGRVQNHANRWVSEDIEARGWQAEHWWEADHIVPVIEGGGGCDFTGYRTLCVWCHRKETAALAARRARRVREKNGVQLDLR